MKILLTNDDGIDAPALYMIKDVLDEFAEVWIFAPDQERSTTGHGISLHRPLQINQIKKLVYECDGLPADCVSLAFDLFSDDKPFDLVLSGTNRGANLGSDIYYSGTAAAAREAAFRGVPSLATSLVLDHHIKGEHMHFEGAIKFLEKFVQNKLHLHLPAESFLNFNFPNTSWEDFNGVKRCLPGIRKYKEKIHKYESPKGDSFYWLGGRPLDLERDKNTDIEAIRAGQVSFTQLNLNHSCQIMESNLDEMLNGLFKD